MNNHTTDASAIPPLPAFLNGSGISGILGHLDNPTPNIQLFGVSLVLIVVECTNYSFEVVVLFMVHWRRLWYCKTFSIALCKFYIYPYP